MSAEWPIEELDTVADEVTVGYVGSMTKEYVESGVPFFRSLNIEPFRINQNGIKFISQDFHRRIKKSSLKPGDVVIVRTGKPGTCAVIPEWIPDANCSDLVVVRCGKRIRPDFLCYWVNSVAAHHIDSYTVGAVQQHFNVGAAKKISIAVPPLSQQDEIITILGSIDDRITLLRETNATLEAIAQAIFKSWFVDFDPVRAKMEGRAPEGMDEATAALFPDSFGESELGLVPREWRVGTLGNILALRSERTKPSEETKMLPYVPIESISAKVPFLQEYKEGEEAKSSLTLFRKGDILFGAMRPYFHKVCIAPFDGVTRTTVFTLKPTNQEAIGFALFLAFQDVTVEYATQHSEGSTIPYAKWSRSLEHMPFILPPESLQIKFSEIVSAFIARANDNIEQAQTLAALRDTLLPRLISGKLRLPEADNAIAEAIA